MSRLAIYRGDQFLEEVVLSRAVMGLGRHPENDIVLDDKTLSRFHARVERRGDRFVVVDLGAQNGVHLNGQRIQGESGLAPGDRISLGRYVAVFEPERDKKGDDLDLDVELDDLLEADRTKNVRPEKEADTKQVPAGREPVLVLLFNGMEVSRHPIAQAGTIVGRSKGADVVISLLGLSRKHARISKVDDGGVVAEDLGSQNGTWVNNQRIAGPQRLRHGDLLNFYDYAVLFLEDGSVDVGFPGAGFKPPAAAGTDELASQETGRAADSPAVRKQPARGVVPLADSGDHGAEKSAVDALDLGEGSFLDEDFGEDKKDDDLSSLLDEDSEAAVDVADLLPDTRAGVDKPKPKGSFDVPGTALSGEDFSAEAAFAAASGFGEEPGTEGDVLKFEDRTSTTNASATGRNAWAQDKELVKALSNVTDNSLVTVEVTLGGKPYTQMPLSQTVTRVGSDSRCELSLPKASGLLPWHVTLLHLGGTVVMYRGGRAGQILLAEASVDMAVLQDGDMLDLGKVRLKLKMR